MRDHRDPPRRAHCFFFFLQAGGGCCWYRPLLLLPPGVKVQEEVQPLPSFLRSERTEPGAAAPPLRRHPCLARRRAHPAAATHSLQPPPSPGSKTRPTPPLPCAPTAAFAFAFCFLCSGAPAPARALQGTQRAPPAGPGKASERALALARRTPPPPCARAPFGCAPAPPGGREGRWRPYLQEGRTSSLVYPLEGRPRKGAGQEECEYSARFGGGWGGYVGGSAPQGLDVLIRAGGVCAGRTCEDYPAPGRTCRECDLSAEQGVSLPRGRDWRPVSARPG